MVDTTSSVNNSTNDTPQLTINEDAASNLDSTYAFEGPEKLLEIQLSASADQLPAGVDPQGLKAVSSDTWKDMLRLVNCEVLSVLTSKYIDCYVLSESSLIVTPSKLILKTCGETTLLLGLARILEIARSVGFPHVSGDLDTGVASLATPYRVFYSRKAYNNPSAQKAPHTSWEQETELLDGIFTGSAYCLGKYNSKSCWYLYCTAPNVVLTPPPTPPPEAQNSHLDALADASDAAEEDETLEILMENLDPEVSRQFYVDSHDQQGSLPMDNESGTKGHALGTVITQQSGIGAIYKDAVIDSFAFTPCGYSANGIVSNNGDCPMHYFTIHVTPEPKFSYASFETNVPSLQSGRRTADIIEQVVTIFKPGKFSVTLFKSKESADDLIDPEKTRKNGLLLDQISGYKRVDRIIHDLDGYNLVYRYYERRDFDG